MPSLDLVEGTRLKNCGVRNDRRVLVIDDNPSIYGDICKALCVDAWPGADLAIREANLLDEPAPVQSGHGFEADFGSSGEEGLCLAKRALHEGKPYAVAFVDLRMSPGWDGLETITRLWHDQPSLQIVVCTAFSDFSWEEIAHRLGEANRWVILKKPFDPIEVLQLAHTLVARKRAEEALRASEAWHRVQFEASQDAILVWDGSKRIIRANPSAVALFGATDENQLLSLTAKDLSPERQPNGRLSAELILEHRETLAERGVLSFEWTGRRISGEEFEVAVNLTRMNFPDGPLTQSSMRDITTRKQEQVALRRSLSQLRATLQSTADGILVVDNSARVTGYNQRFAELFDIPTEMLESCEENPVLVHLQRIAKDPSGFLVRVHAIYAEPTSNSSDLIELADGRIIERFSCPQWVDDRPVARVWSFRDVTKAKQTKKALVEQTLLLEAMLNAIPAPVFYKDVRGTYLNCNPAFLELMQLPRERVIGNDVQENTSRAHAEWIRQKDAALLSSGGSISYEAEHPRADGTSVQLMVTKAIFTTVDGAPAGIVGVILDITERKQSEEKLRSSTERLRMLWQAVQQSPASVLVTDAQGSIQYVNPKFTEVTGYSAEEVLGRKPGLLRSGKTPPATYADLWTTITSGQNWRGRLCNRKKNGKLVWESVLVTPIKDDRGTVVQYLAMKEDITAIKRAEEALRNSNRRLEKAIVKAEKLMVEAEAANLAKSQFLANMSHEIRTPMNSIIGMTGLLLNSPLTSEQRKRAEVVRVSGETLLSLINDILDFSKIEARKLGLEVIDFDLHHTLQQAVEMVAVKAHEKGLEIICRIDSDVPTLVKGDPGRLCQVLVNLAGNAVKFTQRGQVQVHAHLDSEDETRARICVDVTDTGIGIPQERLSILFHPFTQVDGSITRQFGGTGLGLAICKQLVELMGGTISVQSQAGKGSCFSFSVLLDKQPLQPTPDLSSALCLQQARVLVVDDNQANAALLTGCLRDWGCRCAEAHNPAEAIEQLREAAHSADPFLVALLDLTMPDVAATELAARIREDPALKGLKLILMRPLGQGGDVALPPQRRCCTYIYKPIRLTQLYDCLKRAIDGRLHLGERSTLVKPSDRLSRAAGDSCLSILVVEDHPMNQAVILETIKTLGHRADPVANGFEALQSLREIPYHLVLMDCQMPEMDGFEATRRIRAGEAGTQNSRLPIIALTAHALADDRQKCLQAGMDDYLPKPVRIEDVAAILERWGEKACTATKQGECNEAASDSLETWESDKVRPVAEKRMTFNKEMLVSNLMGNQVLAKRAASLFLADLPKQVLALRVSVETKDYSECVRLSHRFKGAFAQLGAETAADIASEMEQAGLKGDWGRLPLLLSRLDGEVVSLVRILESI